MRERFRVFLVGQNGREGRSLDEDKCSGGSQETRACTTTDCPGGVNIELNKTTLTIGLKGIERNSVFKEESMKQKEMDITADSRDHLLTKKGGNDRKSDLIVVICFFSMLIKNLTEINCH